MSCRCSCRKYEGRFSLNAIAAEARKKRGCKIRRVEPSCLSWKPWIRSSCCPPRGHRDAGFAWLWGFQMPVTVQHILRRRESSGTADSSARRVEADLSFYQPSFPASSHSKIELALESEGEEDKGGSESRERACRSASPNVLLEAKKKKKKKRPEYASKVSISSVVARKSSSRKEI